MNKKHEKYVELVRKLNEVNLVARKRAERCNYLFHRLKAMVNCRNREQAEAYTQRIRHHKPKLIDELELIQKLENELDKMPRDWIV